ncbi:MAG: hypothetical protein M3Q97_00255, partial [Bacteroidota bacterium]|nr:hypothetical protein [Bacteroidota bacterium]
MDLCICHLPILNEKNILEGILPAEPVYDSLDKEKLVIDCKPDWLNAHVFPQMHGLEVFQVISMGGLTIVPVVQEDGTYLGSITSKDLITHLGKLYSFSAIGGLIVLRIGSRDYNLQEIARIIESNDTKILMLYMNVDEQNSQLRVTIKVSNPDLSHILATFERYKYQVEYYYPSNPDTDSLRERYEMMMKLFDL